MRAKNRLAAGGVVGTVLATLMTVLLWAATPSAQAHHRPNHEGPKPSPSGSPSTSPTPTPTASPSPTQSPFISPAGGCTGVITFGNPSSACSFVYGGGDVLVAATATQVTVVCHFFFSCFPDLYEGAGASLTQSDGSVLASCYTDPLMPGCATLASPTGVPVGTVLFCHGSNRSTGTFSCGSVRKP